MSGAAQLAEIDLIPADYRQQRALLRTVRVAGFVTLALACAAAAAGAGLRHAAAAVRMDVQRLEATASLVTRQRSEIAGLAARRDALQAEFVLLRGLRTDAAFDELLAIVASAVPADRIWLLEWRVERLGAVIAAAPARAAAHFTIDPEASDVQAVRLQMTIIGEARDHAAVATFADALLVTAGIRDVRIRRASRDGPDSPVKFDLAVEADRGSRRG
ncbi:hypothetical protein BH24PSE2_BH24PSE2_14590 [soil metagenome]